MGSWRTLGGDWCPDKHWRGGVLRHRGHQHLQQAIVLALAGCAVAVLGGSLDEFHTHFVLLELHQEPAAQERAREAPPGGRRLS